MAVSSSAQDHAPVGTSALRITITSNTELPDGDFTFQTQMLRKVAWWDAHTRTWTTKLPIGNPQRMAEVLAHLFEVSRYYKAVARVWADGVGSQEK